MKFHVSHQTDYLYSAPVFLEPHIIRLNPRHDACQKISNFHLEIVPQPDGIHHFLDAAGNYATCIWFAEKTPSLAITTSFEAQTFCTNPFGYLVTDAKFLRLPVSYEKNEAPALACFLAAAAIDKDVQSFADMVLEHSERATLDFLARLCTAVYENFTLETREHGVPFQPGITFQKKSGACRDLVVLFMAICRSYGLAARFVSGYQEGDPDMEQRHLHAWAEVYIPGGGWRGYDPSHGLVVTDRHIALAASFDPGGAAPVSGTFRGTGVTATTSYSISLSAAPQ